MKREFNYKLIAIIITLCLSISMLFACAPGETPPQKAQDVVLLYTNDVHCAFTDNIGYSALSAYKKELEETHEYVTLVDVGDSIHGGLIGLFTKGEYVIDLMNEVGYDMAVLGNHEFDYGIDALSNCINKFDGQYITSNLRYLLDGENPFSSIKPYQIYTYGEKKVAYIGLASPMTIGSSTTFFYDENGQKICDFYEKDAQTFYDHVQGVVDEVNSLGVDHVVVCGHLGSTDSYSPFSSRDLIANISGIDVLLDGHSHSTIEQEVLKDKNNNDVILSSTGSNLRKVGQLTITSDGKISTKLISSLEKSDPEIDAYLQSMNEEFESVLGRVVATSNQKLSIYDEDGVRMVRNRETAIGNLCADAFREIGRANVGIVNGGGVRSSLPEGQITYKNVSDVFPFGDKFAVVKVSGQNILDALELSVSKTKKEYKDNGNAVGEAGSFLQVSGIKFDVDTSIPSSVVFDENELFAGVSGERRVKNVLIQGEDGTYSPLQLDTYYILATTDYIVEGGGGYSMFTDAVSLLDGSISDIEVLVNYINYINGDLSKYQQTEGRINIK